MSKRIYIISFILCFALFASFTLIDTQKQNKDIVKERLLGNIKQIRIGLKNLEKSVNSKNIVNIKSNFKELRNSYKKSEYLLEYIDNETIKRYINGAPLPWTDYKDATPKVYEPQGFQIIEELIYEDSINFEEVKQLFIIFNSQFNQYLDYVSSVKLQDRFIFEAARFEYIRIFTQSLTGFDTPASGNSIEESKNALNTLKEDLALYSNGKSVSKELNSLLIKSVEYLEKNNDFDNLDRLTFVRDFIEPLFSLTIQLQEEIQIESYSDVNKFPKAFNYKSRSIFSDELLNPFYYTNSLSKADSTLMQLGAKLFFDNTLSKEYKQSCASCHVPNMAYTDGLKTNKSNTGKDLERNTPTLLNSIYADRYFYDLRASSPEMQMEHVFLNENEFNTNIFDLVARLKADNSYNELFNKAFAKYNEGNDKVNITNIKRAITAFITGLRSFNSRVDKYIKKESNDLTEAEKRGFNLFMGKAVCGTCHFPPTFSGLVPPFYEENESEVIGVPSKADTINATLDNDYGRYSGILRDNIPIYKYSFKTTTIRNIEHTAPYMHNGVYKTLEEVVDFYNRGGGKSIGISLAHQTLPFDNLNLTKQEQKDLVAFMKALSDLSNKLPIIEYGNSNTKN
jgi:cytochrome c peroxidase